MDIVNAIARVRFGSAKPQRVHLHKGDGLDVELLCMEAGQKTKIDAGEVVYYVVTGTAALSESGRTVEVPTGQLVSPQAMEPHTVANAGEGRLVILATRSSA